MLERNWFDLKYIDVFSHHASSMGALSRRRMFNLGTNTKRVYQWADFGHQNF
jgi:hypothetical protein